VEKVVFQDGDFTVKEKRGVIPLFNRVHLIKANDKDLIWISFPYFVRTEEGNTIMWSLTPKLSVVLDKDSHLVVLATLDEEGELVVLPVVLKDEGVYRFYEPVVELERKGYEIRELEELVKRDGVRKNTRDTDKA